MFVDLLIWTAIMSYNLSTSFGQMHSFVPAPLVMLMWFTSFVNVSPSLVCEIPSDTYGLYDELYSHRYVPVESNATHAHYPVGNVDGFASFVECIPHFVL